MENWIMLYKHLDQIRQRPILFGIYTVEEMSSYILGIAVGKKLYGNDDADFEMEDFKKHFQKWVKTWFQVKSHQHWSKIIRFFSTSDENSLEVFYQSLDAFKIRNDIPASAPPVI